MNTLKMWPLAKILQAGLLQLEPHHDRQEAADEPAQIANTRYIVPMSLIDQRRRVARTPACRCSTGDEADFILVT